MKRRILALLLVPLAAFPILATSLLVADFLAGERLLSLYLRHEQRLLWDTFWADYTASLPVMYGLIGTLVVVLLATGRVSGFGSKAYHAVAVFLVVGWGIAVYLTGSAMGAGHLAIGVTAAVLGSLVGWCLRSFSKPDPLLSG